MRIKGEGKKVLSWGEKPPQFYVCKIVPQHTLFLESLVLGLVFIKGEFPLQILRYCFHIFLGKSGP